MKSKDKNIDFKLDSDSLNESPALELRAVSVILAGRQILKKVSFKVYHGESLVIIGQSGEGKSVLLKTMAGIYKPSNGLVLVEGESWLSMDKDEKRSLAKKVGMLFQKSALFDSLNAIENVSFPLNEHNNFSKDEIREKSLFLLESVGLLKDKNKFPHELSGGMKRRLGIARALALNPEIIFYDDPTAGQDPINSDKIAKLILGIKKKNNSTFIAVTNDIDLAYQLADRIVMVTHSEVLGPYSVESLKSSSDERIQQFIHGRLKGPLSIRS